MAKKKVESCAFCGRPANQSEVMIPSGINPEVYLCAECADAIHEILNEFRGTDKEKKSHDTTAEFKEIPKPKEICKFLDQ